MMLAISATRRPKPVRNEAEKDTARCGGDQGDRGEQAGLRCGELQFAEQFTQDHGVQRNVHAVEHPAQGAGGQGVALTRRTGDEKCQRICGHGESRSVLI